MNISPVSFGKVVRIKDRLSNAENLAALANSPVMHKSHATIQKDAQELFDDVTAKGQAQVITLNNGKDTFIISGKDSEIISNILDKQEPYAIKVENYRGEPHIRKINLNA